MWLFEQNAWLIQQFLVHVRVYIKTNALMKKCIVVEKRNAILLQKTWDRDSSSNAREAWNIGEHIQPIVGGFCRFT